MSAPGLPGWIGLARRAGDLVVGTAGVRAALKRDDVAVVVLAGDHSARTEDKVARLARARGVIVIDGPTAGELGRWVGRESVEAVGVVNRQLADGMLAQYSGSTAGGQRGE